MSSQQTCPHCGEVNWVVGLFRDGELHGTGNNDIYCGHCGKRFAPTEDALANPFRQHPGAKS